MPVYDPTDRSSAAAARERDQLLYELRAFLEGTKNPSLAELIALMKPLVFRYHSTIPEVLEVINPAIYPRKLVNDPLAGVVVKGVTTVLNQDTLNLKMVDVRSEVGQNESVHISVGISGDRLVIEGGQFKLTSRKSFQAGSVPRRALDWLLGHRGMTMTHKAIGLASSRKLSDLARDIGFKSRLRELLMISGTKELTLKADISIGAHEWRELAYGQDVFDVERRES